MERSGKIIVITGGGSGIGFAIAQILSQDNTVISLDRNREKIARLRELLPAVESIETDITDTDQLRRALGQIESRFGRIDVLINNAGVGGALDFQTMEAAEIGRAVAKEMQVNFEAPILLTRLALPLLEKAAEPVVAFTTSGVAYTPSATHPTYSASKAALHSFVLSLRHQLRDGRIKVVELLPPTVDTAFTRDIKGPKITPEQVAAAFAKGLKANRLTIRVGQAGALALISRITPAGAFRMLNPVK